MNKDLGVVVGVSFHRRQYLNYWPEYDANAAKAWYDGRINNYGREDAAGRRKTAARESYTSPRTEPITDRVIYLIADHDLVQGTKRVHVCAVLYADAERDLTFLQDSPIPGHPQTSSAITLPVVVNGQRVKYCAIASKVEVDKRAVDNWLSPFDNQPTGDPDCQSYVGHTFGWCDPNYLHTFLGDEELEVPMSTDENGEVVKGTVSVLRFPVLDPMAMAHAHADVLRDFLRGYEKEFGFHRALVNESVAKVDADTKRWCEYRLALMLDSAQDPGLRAKVDDIRPGALSGLLRSRTLVQEGYQQAVDLAAGNLTTWLRRDVVMAWFNICHLTGTSDVSGEKPLGEVEQAKLRMLADFAEAIRDLHQTRSGNLFAELLPAAGKYYSFVDEYLADGKAMKNVMRTRSAVGLVLSIHKLVYGRLVARGKRKVADALVKIGGYLRDADVLKSADEIWEQEHAYLKFLFKGKQSTLTDDQVEMGRVLVRTERLQKTLGSTDNASAALSMLGWLSTMESVRAYAEALDKGDAGLKDHVSMVNAVVSQSLATAELVLGDELEKASRRGLKVSISALGVVTNVVDVVLAAQEADALMKKGDTDAGLLTAASAALIMIAIPFGIAGMWVGTALTIVAGILAFIADLVKDETWDQFLNNTTFGRGDGGGSWSPDWAGVTFDALKLNPALQMRALANLLSNFRLRRLGGGTGPQFGVYTLELELATPDPLAVFLIKWQFSVSGEAETQTSITVATTFTGASVPDDGGKLRIPGTLRGPDGKTSLAEFEQSPVKIESGTKLRIGDPYDMRAYEAPGHRWQHSKITGLSVEVRRLTLQPFGRPAAEDAEWLPLVKLDLTEVNAKVRLFNDAD